MVKRLVVLLSLGLLAALVPVASASAGGWAVTTLDEVPDIRAGEPATLGFTIRQHGTTPVWPEEGEVAIAVTASGGETSLFPGVREGAVGHYTASVLLPEGSYRWEVRQGWFAPQPLGDLVVRPVAAVAPVAAPTAQPARSEATSPAPRGSLAVRLLLPTVAVCLAALAASDLLRRRSRTATA